MDHCAAKKNSSKLDLLCRIYNQRLHTVNRCKLEPLCGIQPILEPLCRIQSTVTYYRTPLQSTVSWYRCKLEPCAEYSQEIQIQTWTTVQIAINRCKLEPLCNIQPTFTNLIHCVEYNQQIQFVETSCVGGEWIDTTER